MPYPYSEDPADAPSLHRNGNGLCRVVMVRHHLAVASANQQKTVVSRRQGQGQLMLAFGEGDMGGVGLQGGIGLGGRAIDDDEELSVAVMSFRPRPLCSNFRVRARRCRS